MRVYIPVTRSDVERRATEGFWTVSPRRGWAVNPALARALPDEDDEGREFIASLTAASESASHLAIAADIPTSMLGDEGTHGDVEVQGVVRDADVACILQRDPDDEDALIWFAPAEFATLLER